MNRLGKLGTVASFWTIACCCGCSMLGYSSLHLSADVVNEGNRLLTVEGDTNLPDGFPIVVAISENDTVLFRTQSSVAEGLYNAVFDITDLGGNVNYNLDIYSDPTLWNGVQREKFGDMGQFMLGNQVESVGNLNRLIKHLTLVLPMDEREVAIRRIKNGEYSHAISTLEAIVAESPDDQVATAWLALALVLNNKGEQKLDSRACYLMRDLKMKNLPPDLAGQCTIWLERWKDQEAELLSKRERQMAIDKHRREAKARLLEFVPGKMMADISIGESSKHVFSVCPLEGSLDWNSEIVRFDIPKRNIMVYFDPQTRNVVEISTRSKNIRHSSGLGVDSELKEIEAKFPGGECIWEGDKSKDGVEYGQYIHPKGIIFGIKREEIGLGLTLDRVYYVSIIAPQ